MSEAKRGEKHPMYGLIGKNNHNFGKIRSQDTKDKMSRAQGTTIYVKTTSWFSSLINYFILLPKL